MNTPAYLLQHYCGAGSLLPLSHDRHERICEEQGIVFLTRDFHVSHRNLSQDWAKIFFLIELLYEAADGALFIWLDHDALIVRNEDLRSALPNGFDFGAVKNRWLAFNLGVMFIRNTVATRRMLENCVRMGPTGCNSWEHDTVNYELSRGRVKAIELPSVWNTYKDVFATTARPPIIKAWHNEDKIIASQGMRVELARLSARLPVDRPQGSPNPPAV